MQGPTAIIALVPIGSIDIDALCGRLVLQNPRHYRHFLLRVLLFSFTATGATPTAVSSPPDCFLVLLLLLLHCLTASSPARLVKKPTPLFAPATSTCALASSPSNSRETAYVSLCTTGQAFHPAPSQPTDPFQRPALSLISLSLSLADSPSLDHFLRGFNTRLFVPLVRSIQFASTAFSLSSIRERLRAHRP